MDWNAAIEKNRQALKRVLAGLRAMAHIDAGDERPEPLPRILHRAVLRLLRPAKSAARRLVIVAARGIAVTLPKPREAKTARSGETPPPPPRFTGSLSPVSRGGSSVEVIRDLGSSPAKWGRGAAAGSEGGGAEPRLCRPCLPLFDPPSRRGRRRYCPPAFVPRISVPGVTRRAPLRRPPNPFDELDTGHLASRLAALGAALDDLPRHARRFALWRAKRDAEMARIRQCNREAAGRDAPAPRSPQPRRIPRLWPLRAGRPPGRHSPRSRCKPHEVHAILETVHGLAFWALEPADTS